jgi:hypothetical protein
MLPWILVSGDAIGIISGGNGFSSGLLTFALILLLAAAAVALLPAFGVNVKLPFPRGLLLIGLTGLAALLTLVEFIDVLGADDDLAAIGGGFDVSTGFGAWLGMLVALGAVVLSVMTLRANQAGQPAVA